MIRPSSIPRLLRALLLLALAAGLAAPAALAVEGETRLLRYPDIHRDQVVFSYAGDLWLVGSRGGEARRLTSHPGLELSPRFSPDGRWIAYSGEYGGTRQVFVISAEGGEPRQLTFYNDVGQLPPRGGFDNRVLGWTPDGSEVLFLANRLPWGPRRTRPYLVPAEGGMERPLPVVEAGGGELSPGGTRFVFTPSGREFRTWKRYQGGQQQDVWIFDLESLTAEQITDFPGTDRQPMWVGDTIYFTSDRGGKLNLYRYDGTPGAATQVTFHDDWDVLWPATDGERIVYQAGGRIHLFDPATGRSEALAVKVVGDFPGRLPTFKPFADFVSSASPSPSGKRVVMASRGEVYTVPAEEGPARNLTRSQGVREMDPTWSPDGRTIAYLSDATGEYEIYVAPQDGSGPARQVTTGGHSWRFPPRFSPDGRYLAFADTRHRLRYVEVESGRVTDVDSSSRGDITQYSWSPDSRWLAYWKVGEGQRSSIWVHSLDKAESWQLTSDFTNDYSPVFDPQGRYLYFLSDRDYNLTFSGFEFTYVYTDPTRVYVAVLAEDGPALFLPGSDEEPVDEAEDGGDKGDGNGEEEVSVTLDVDGFDTRVLALPGLAPGNYRSLSAVDKGVLYLVGNGPETRLELYDLEAEKAETVLSGINGYEVAAGGTKLLFQQGNAWGLADVAPGGDASKGHLALADLEVPVDPPAEWRQMFVDAWRILRDWFYDPGMHGADWPALRQRYGELVPHIAHRADLDFILGELGGELEAGHVYVQPGDQPQVQRRDGGLLGAEIEADPSGVFRVARIFPGENWDSELRSPLTEPGVGVAAGDFILAVDGRPASEVANFYQLLEGKGGQVVTLTVADSPDGPGREVRVETRTSETPLRYLDWVLSRRQRVAEASGGRIGYVHLPNTAFEGNRELFKAFYPQATKEALIVDVRYNGGGFIPDRMIELLDRPVLNYWARRGLELVSTPGFAHQGPKAVLINGYAGSGGDAFPYYFKKRDLGPLIGTTTWGGLIGISGNPSLVDGGTVTAPSFRFVDTEGEWAVEGIGVEPDIEVVDRPDQLARGEDPSLEKAIAVLLAELEHDPPEPLEAPQPPGR